MKSKLIHLTVILFLLLTASGEVLLGQTADGCTVCGVVHSPSRVVPVFEVSLVNEATGKQHRTTTKAQERFLLVPLHPGNFTLKVEMPGFKKYQSGILIKQAETRAIHVAPEVEEGPEGVTVASEAQGIEREAGASEKSIPDEPSDDLSIISRIVGSDISRIASVARYHTAVLMTRFEQFEAAYEALVQFVVENNTSPKVLEALGLSILRMPFLPSEYPRTKRELVLLAGRAAYEMAARRVENAHRLFRELISRYPAEPNVNYAYGVFLIGSEPDKGLQHFQRELQINPAHVPSLLQMALEYLRQGRYKEALPLAEKAAELAPDFFTARNVLGRIFLETGKIERAIQELELGVQLAPDNPEMHFALSRAYARAGRKEDAEQERHKFLLLDRIFRSKREGPQAVGGLVQPGN